MSKITQLDALKQTAQRAKGYTAKLTGEVSAAVLDAIKEMDRAKADRVASVTITIPAAGWVADSKWAEYPLRYDVTAASITAADHVAVTVLPDSLSTAATCGLCPVCETQAGKLRIWARKAPSKSLNASYAILQGEIKEG